LKHTIPCHVKGGRPNNAKKLNAAFQEFEGKDVVVTVEKKKSKRSDAQNRYFHGVIIPVIQHGLIEAGWNEARSSEWTKDFIKLNCLIKTLYKLNNTPTASALRSGGFGTPQLKHSTTVK
jgi:hypothetical protein